MADSNKRKRMPFVTVTVPCAFEECPATCEAKMEIWGGGKMAVIIGDSLPAGWTPEHVAPLYSGYRSTSEEGYRCPEHEEVKPPWET